MGTVTTDVTAFPQNAPSSPDTVTVQGVGEAPLLVPSLNHFGLMLLIVLIGGIGFVVTRQR